MNRLWRRVLTLLMTLLLTCPLLYGGARAAESTEDMLERVKPGVVQLYTVEYRNGRPTGNGGRGTGFAVGTAGKDSDVFVTNWHVVTGSGAFDPDEARVYIALDNASFSDAVFEEDSVIPCDVIYISKSGKPDMAILRAAEPVTGFKALPVMSADKIRDGAHVVALGYPGVLDDVSATNGGVNDMNTTQGFISRHSVGTKEDDDLAGTKLLFFDALISHGNSGGALVNDAGAVVGINTYGFEGFSAAVYIDYAMEALDSLGIPYDVYEAEEVPVAAIVLIGVGAVIVVIAVLVLVLRLKRPVVKTETFTLVGPGAQRTPVPVSGLVIGRDPNQCALSLPAETKGVSRRHCQVAVTGGALMLTDLGSSYGTFTAGQKLEPHRPVPLSKGSSFYLGDKAIAFTVQ